MKFPWTVAVNTAIFSLLISSAALNANSKTHWNTATETLVKERVAHIKLPFQATYSPEIYNQIKLYLVNGKRQTQRMLGRADLFFPIFEHNLKINDLPRELKYLPIIESELRPTVKSPVGAAGLWQFVPATARLYGIKVNSVVDERLDPYRSTEAATKLLKKLYTEYCDWSLVLAAYNCGTIRVNKAIRLAGSTDYSKIKRFLPKETQNYLLRFVAAAYVANYYGEHGLSASHRYFEFDDIRTMKVEAQLSFSQISEITGMEINLVKKLNPSYLKGLIPASEFGNYLVLPSEELKKIASHLRRSGNSTASLYLPLHSFEKTYTVKVGEDINGIAERFGCLETEILAWNNLRSSNLKAHQEILLFFKPEVKWDRA